MKRKNTTATMLLNQATSNLSIINRIQHKLILILLAGLTTTALCHSKLEATEFYEFETTPCCSPGEVFAILELDLSQPSSLQQYTSLNFTPAGAAAFGLSAGPYSESFDASPTGPFTDDGFGNLQGATIIDSVIPANAAFPSAQSLVIRAGPPLDDIIQLQDSFGINAALWNGQWQLVPAVPEPSSIALLWLGLLSLGLIGWRRRRR